MHQKTRLKNNTHYYMLISYFEYKTRQIDAVKDKPDFIKKYGKEFMRAFQEEMEYAAHHAIVDTSIDLNAELDKIEAKYRFNEDMEVLLDATATIVRWAAMTIHSDCLRKSKEANLQIKAYCKVIMEEMERSVAIFLDPVTRPLNKDEEYEAIKDIIRRSANDNNDKEVPNF